MAVVSTKVEVMREGNAEVAVKTEQVLDVETGLVLERKTIVAAVPTKDGKTAVIAGQQTTLAAVQVYANVFEEDINYICLRMFTPQFSRDNTSVVFLLKSHTTIL